MEFIETIAIRDGRVINRDGHLKRMRETAAHFGFSSPNFPNLARIMPPSLKSGLVKCRLLYDQLIRDITFELYTPRKIISLIAVNADKLDYAFKYADRRALEYERWKLKGFDEVVFLKDGFLTDSSFSNIVLRRGNEYITPETYLLNGTQRQLLLKSGRIKEAPVHITALKEYDELILINAMLNLKNGLRFPVNAVHLITNSKTFSAFFQNGEKEEVRDGDRIQNKPKFLKKVF